MGRADKQPVLDRVILDAKPNLQLVGQEGLAVSRVDKLDPEQEPAPADVVDHRIGLERERELIAKLRPSLANALDQPAGFERVDHGEADRAGLRSPIPGVTKVEGAR